MQEGPSETMHGISSRQETVAATPPRSFPELGTLQRDCAGMCVHVCVVCVCVGGCICVGEGKREREEETGFGVLSWKKKN